MKWRLLSDSRFYDAGESTVVFFDTRSGDTHLLSDFAAYVLQQFADTPLTLGDITQRLSSTVDDDQQDDLASNVHIVLDELVSLQILQQI